MTKKISITKQLENEINFKQDLIKFIVKDVPVRFVEEKICDSIMDGNLQGLTTAHVLLTALIESKNKKVITKKPVVTKKPAKKVAAFMRPMTLSSDLKAVVGPHQKLARTEVMKKVWQYIKRHNLQNMANSRLINADENLSKIFGGKKSVTMFEMTKFVSNHLK